MQLSGCGGRAPWVVAPVLAVLGLVAWPSEAWADACTYCDLTGDFQVNGADVLAFTACMTGPAVAPAIGCERFNLDADADIDQEDFGVLQACFGQPAGPVYPLISEVMAVNNTSIEDEDGAHSDWFEIYNPGSTAANLTGWYVTDKPDNLDKWQFPAVSIPAKGYLVVWASEKDRAVAGSPLHTNFKLTGDGEYLAMVKPDGVTVVSQYSPTFPLQVSDVSYGITMNSTVTPLVAPGAACRVRVPSSGSNPPSTWKNLSYGDGSWTSGTTGVGYDQNTSSVNYLPLIGTNVESIMYDIRPTIYIRIPFSASGPAAYDRLILRMKYDDGFIAYINGTAVAWANEPDSPGWNSVAPAAHDDAASIIYEDFDISDHLGALQTGSNVLAIHAFNVSKTSSDLLIVPELNASRSSLIQPRVDSYFMAPTPGWGNQGGTATVGPFVTEVAHAPIVPAEGEDLTVTAKVAMTFHPVSGVELHYRVMYGSTTTVAMADDGAHGDGAAGDGVYGAVIPASASTPDQMVRWYFTATDNAGNSTRWPLFSDPANSPEYYGTVVQNPAVTSQLPILQWFVENPPSDWNSVSERRCSVFFLDEFYDNVGVRVRGNTSRGWPKQHLKFDFNTGYHFRFDANQGRVEEFNLNSTYSDKAYIRQVLAAETYRDAGAAYGMAFPMRVQQNGAFYSVAIFVEQPDKDYLDRNGLDPRGALYKMSDWNPLDTGSGTNAEKKTREYEDFSDLAAFVTGINLADTEARKRYIFDNVDLPATLNYLAATTVMHDNDHVAKNYYMYRDTEGSGEWQFLPWDKDLTFGRNFTLEGGVLNDTMWADVDQPYIDQPWVGPSHPLFGDSDHQKADSLYNCFIDALNDTPEFREMHMRRLRTLMEAQLQPPGTPAAQLKYEARIDQLVSEVQADVALDLNRWADQNIYYGEYQNLATAISHMKNEYLAPRRVHLFNTHGPSGDGLIPAAQPADPSIQFGVIEHSPASMVQDEEYVELVNANTYAVDISGWQFQVYDDTNSTWETKHTFRPGTVLRASSSLYLTPNTVAFRARATSPKGGEGRFIQGNYHHHVAPGELIRLLDAAGAVVATATVGG